MVSSPDLASRLREYLPRGLSRFLRLAGQAASDLDMELYLVGGAVRDLLLGIPNQDLDLVAEGDAILLAKNVTELAKGEAVYHPRFKTATVRWEKWSVDLASARSETYARPGALPTVHGSDIQMDLFRRDFSINAMAVSLAPLRYGKLLDPFQGTIDLREGKIRVLHDNSFRDDSTRIWRAVRYEQRLGFEIESHTLGLVKRDLSFLGTVSGERLRHELELVLKEERPEKALLKARTLGVLAGFQPPLDPETRLIRQFANLRSRVQPYAVPEELYLALLVYNYSPEELSLFNSHLKFPREVLRVLKDTLELKPVLKSLAGAQVSNSSIYRLLQPFSHLAILANLVAQRSTRIRERMELYLNQLRFIRTALSGDDLIRLGVAEGPKIKKILGLLLAARLDGRVVSRADEMALVKKMGSPA